MRRLYTAFVQQPDDTYLSTIVELNPKFNQFNGAIGAIDGTHIPAFIPLANQRRFQSRKNNISQNVLTTVTFNGIFTYVLAGAKGSINDAALLPQALLISLRIPKKRFYLANASFGQRRGILIPFSGIHHLRDFTLRDRLPRNDIELFNLRHAQLRTIVEQVFSRCKRK